MVKSTGVVGSVGKFSIYQLVERLMQRNGDDVIAPVALSPVEWLFSEFICPIEENVRAGGAVWRISTVNVSAIRSTFALIFIQDIIF